MNTFAPDATLAPAAAIARRRARAMAAFRDAGETFHAMISRASVFSEKAHRRSGSLHRDSIPADYLTAARSHHRAARANRAIADELYSRWEQLTTGQKKVANMYRMAGERHDAAADKHLARANRDLDEPVTMESADGQPFDDDGDTFAEDTFVPPPAASLARRLQRFTTPSMPPATGFQEDISDEVGRDLTAKQLGTLKKQVVDRLNAVDVIFHHENGVEKLREIFKEALTALDKIAVVKD